jgi:type II secretory pathway component PulJ
VSLRRRIRTDDRGLSVAELGVSLVITAIASVVMVAWVVAVTRTDQLHQADDNAMQQLRIAKEKITRDLRRAEALTVADPQQVTVWLDDDRDGAVDGGELVTWMVTQDGNLVRSTDLEPGTTEVERLSYRTGFRFDATVPGDVETVGIELVALVESGGGLEERVIQTDVYLRNS